MSIDPSRLTSASFIFPIPPRYSAIVSEYVTKFVENPCCSDPVLLVLITSRKTPNLVESYPENMMSLVPSLSTSATSMEFDIDWGSMFDNVESKIKGSCAMPMDRENHVMRP